MNKRIRKKVARRRFGRVRVTVTEELWPALWTHAVRLAELVAPPKVCENGEERID